MRNAKFFMTICPSTNKVLKEFPFASAADVSSTLAKAHEGFKFNKQVPLSTRIQKILNIADILEKRKMECAELMATEMGKPIKFGVFEVNEVIGIMKHKAAVAEGALQPQILGPLAKKAYTLLQPMGIHFCRFSY
jgi:succinate-semialdehyde dehydrogenase/glutarate-semialdehyde dehydrogenase